MDAGGSMPGRAMKGDKQAIRKVVAEWHRATAAGDVDAVLRLMTKDAVFLVPGRAPMNRIVSKDKVRRSRWKSCVLLDRTIRQHGAAIRRNSFCAQGQYVVNLSEAREWPMALDARRKSAGARILMSSG
jgi:ketosteroid isomerase-like protein